MVRRDDAEGGPWVNLLGLPHPWIRVEGVHGAGAIVTVVGFEGHEPEHGGISAWELRWSEPDSYRRSPMPIDFGVFAGGAVGDASGE